jgi:hypothetical protein
VVHSTTRCCFAILREGLQRMTVAQSRVPIERILYGRAIKVLSQIGRPRRQTMALWSRQSHRCAMDIGNLC